MKPYLTAIARQFTNNESIDDIQQLGHGLINETFIVTAASKRFVLQGINCRVFPKPEKIMSNIHELGQHIRQLPAADVHLRIPEIFAANNGESFFLDSHGRYWRAMEYIEPSECREHLTRQGEAEQIGYALAHFHRLCCSLPINKLQDTLPGFHITPRYFEHYQNIIRKPLRVKTDADFHYCQTFIEARHEQINHLEQAKQQAILVERVIHGDPKVNNFLFKPGYDQVISLIDLDTVKPGLVHYDIGDCLRSCCHRPDGNSFDLDCCKIILKNYLLEARHFFSVDDYEFLYPAIALIPFELGLRFFNDYLDENRYFKVNAPNQNLQRAVAQFQLCESIAHQRLQIDYIISSLK